MNKHLQRLDPAGGEWGMCWGDIKKFSLLKEY